eukprot:gene28399-35198_t
MPFEVETSPEHAYSAVAALTTLVDDALRLAELFWKLGREKAFRRIISKNCWSLHCLAALLSAPCKTAATSALWALTMSPEVCAATGKYKQLPALLKLVASPLETVAVEEESCQVRSYSAAVLGNLAAAPAVRAVLISISTVLNALAVSASRQAGWAVQRAALSALWRIVVDGGRLERRQVLCSAPQLLETLVQLISAGEQTEVDQDAVAREKVMYGTTMLGMLAEEKNCR